MEVVCPKCGFEHSVKSRGRTGGGTRRKLNTLNWNTRALCYILRDALRNLTVREVQKFLYDRGILRLRRGEKVASGGWNYHDVQANLSLLVGNAVISMSGRGEESFDGQGYVVSPIPRYYMSNYQKTQLLRIKENDWKL